MSRRSRRAVRRWNNYICPAIEITVSVLAMFGLFVAFPLALVLTFG